MICSLFAAVMRITILFLLIVPGIVLVPSSLALEKINRQDLGRSAKMTILVDKVMQPQAEWVTEEWMVKATAEAGFNVFSPRRGHDRLDEVRQVTEWCRKYGIYHMPWMRGSLEAPDGADVNGKRLVWVSGNEQPLWSPNSDEFWDWTNRFIIEYAKISVQDEHLMGVFLDYENYASGKEGNLYSLSYDDIIMVKFAQSKGVELPGLDLAKRKSWLESEDLHDEFSQFQIKHWRERCRILRKAVDEINPEFQFCVYPAPGTPFMVEAIYPEWSTKSAPLILADASTYGRSSQLLSQVHALEANRQKLLDRVQTPKNAGIPFIYVGGIDPVVRGADPEFSGKNAVMISEVTDGYWIFYEGPTYTKQDHADYWKWFTWANKAIADDNFKVQYEPRETAEEWWNLGEFELASDSSKLVAPEVTGEKVKHPVIKLRGQNLLLVAGKKGQPLELILQNHPVASYKSFLAWELRNLEMTRAASGTIQYGKSGAINFTPEYDGVYLLGVSAGQCAYSVVSSNVPVGLYAGDRLSFIYAVNRIYFSVPDNVDQFTITARGSGAETVRVNVLSPEGNQVATGQTTLKEGTVKVRVSAGDYSCDIWSLELTRADEGTLEDHSIILDPRLTPILSLNLKHVFDARSR
ncbi:hypothetical protein ACFL6S_13300 [Candidatus Poribacteria bacterium]